MAKVLSEQTNMALPDIELLKNLTNDKDQNCVQNLKNKVKSSKSRSSSRRWYWLVLGGTGSVGGGTGWYLVALGQ